MQARADDYPLVDVLMLTRPHTRAAQQVVQAIENQRNVAVRIHYGHGWPQRSDPNRWFTIARGRNELKSQGQADWVMFVDDDVVLGPDCIKTLLGELQASPRLAALAADYEEEQRSAAWTGHVTMGACLFRRELLRQIEFRATSAACECLCCCHDLREAGYGITYSRTAQAIHLKTSGSSRPCVPVHRPSWHGAEQCGSQPGGRFNGTERSQTKTAASPRPLVLAALDRRDIKRFVHAFLPSLRRWENRQLVIAVVYGAYPSEQDRLRRIPGVHLITQPFNGQMVPVRRLVDFSAICDRLLPSTPVAYWDVADVIFQSNLAALWAQIQSAPDRIIAVSEPKGYPENRMIPAWSLSIKDPQHRRHVFELLQGHPFLNSGFAAGTAQTLGRYFHQAVAYLNGPQLGGTTDWGDQMCLNLYCHSHPERWHETDRGWNYCVHDRRPGEVYVAGDGTVYSRTHGRVPVVHGNARSLRQVSLL